MKIKIIKDEYLFDVNGCHICDHEGFAVKAKEDQECEIDDQHSDRVLTLLSQDRALRGLMPDGSVPVIQEPKVPQELLDAELSKQPSDDQAGSDTPES